MYNLVMQSITDNELYKELDTKLENSVDKDILKDLDKYLDIVRKQSRALASSLKRCFTNAKKSHRYVEAYKLGISGQRIADSDEELQKYLEKELKDFFEKNDFMHYREFVRLLRACTIDVGGEISFEIKKMYKEYFNGKRLVEAYKLGTSVQRIADRHN